MLQDASARYFISDGIIKIIFGASRPLHFCAFLRFFSPNYSRWQLLGLDLTSRRCDAKKLSRATAHIVFEYQKAKGGIESTIDRPRSLESQRSVLVGG